MRYNLFFKVLTIATLGATTAFSQGRMKTDEVIMLRGNGSRTVVEIRNGAVYINGDKVATVDAGGRDIRKKIIIEAHGDEQGAQQEDRPGRAGSADEVPHRAVLGVLTDNTGDGDGAKIIRVNPGSPAEEAGLRAGDRITELDGKIIKDAAGLTREVGSNHRPGDQVNIVYERNGKVKTTAATLEEAPANMPGYRFNAPNSPERDDLADMPMLRSFRLPDGMSFGDEAQRPRIGVSVEDRDDGHGVKITGIVPGAAAAKGGLREGDIITKVDGEAVESVSQLQDMIRSRRPGDKLSLSYRRNGTGAAVELVLPRIIRKKEL